MSRKNGLTGFNKVSRAIGLWCAFLIMLSSVTLIVLLSMDLVGVNTLEAESPREYWIQFESEGRLLFDNHYRRGEKISKPADPTHSEDEYYVYTFRGWDISGDNNPDFIPNHAYYSFLAVAVYQRRQIKPLPVPSSNPEETSENDDGDSSFENGEGLLIGEIYG